MTIINQKLELELQEVGASESSAKKRKNGGACPFNGLLIETFFLLGIQIRAGTKIETIVSLRKLQGKGVCR